MQWNRYSKKMHEKIMNPLYAGEIQEAGNSQTRVVSGQEGSIQKGSVVRFFLLVNEVDGIIIDARYQMFGEPLLVALCEVLCELVIKKNYQQAARIGSDLLDKKLQDDSYANPLPKEKNHLMNLVMASLYEALSSCQDLSIKDPYIESPIEKESGGNSSIHHSSWPSYTYEEKIEIIAQVIKQEIEPYIALDEGGVSVKELVADKEVIILYQGACTSCYSSIGATLQAIEQILKNRVHPEIKVTPDQSVLKF